MGPFKMQLFHFLFSSYNLNFYIQTVFINSFYVKFYSFMSPICDNFDLMGHKE